jgi:3'(2'), 5'-bisphosphate nucleotidase
VHATSDPPAVDARLLDALTEIVSRAAAAILAIAPGPLAARIKADLTPVTLADEASDAVIAEGLARILPGVPVICEEAREIASVPDGTYLIVDPLDGTREFIAGRQEYTVNLALVAAGRPLMGILAAPAVGLIYRGVAGKRAERLRLAPGEPPHNARETTEIHVRPRPADGLVAVVSRSHLDAATKAYLTHLPLARQIASGSALKFCWLAEGTADVYPRLSPTFQWDVAAGHAVLTAAGGLLTTPAGGVVTYGAMSREDLRLPGFLAWGDPKLAPTQA